MPNEFSNFTTQDTDRPDGGFQGGYTNGGSDDGSHRWDPNAYNEQTGKNGKWVPIDQRESVPTFDKGAWGGMGERLDGNGNPIAGTDGANVDRERYLGMQGPVHENGPVIDQTRGQESRGWGMGALDLLRKTAQGQQPSVAEKLGTQQGIDAQNARMGIAASVRGGAAARGAAARAGQADTATIGQQTLQSNAATRAGEMAQARDAYFGAASGQRGQDLGVATEQGGLEMGQRSANDQRDSFYANRAQDVNRVQTASRLGASAADINARDQAARQAESRQAQADAHQQKMIGTGYAMGGGAAAGYAKTRDGSSDDDDGTTSDENAKDNMEPVSTSKAIRARARKEAEDDGASGDIIRDDPYADRRVGDKEAKQLTARSDEMMRGMEKRQAQPSAVAQAQRKNSTVSDAEARRLMARSDEMISGTKQRLKARKDSLVRDDPYSDTTQEDADKKASLDAAIGARVAEDRPPAAPAKPEDQRSAAVNRYAGQLFGVGSAPKGYAQMRAGQEGGLFGADKEQGLAPGSEDDRVSRVMRDPYSREIAGLAPLPKFKSPGRREIATSDDRAKLDAAYERGKQDAGKVANTPASGVRKLAVTSSARGKDQLSVQRSAYDAEQNDALDAQHAAFDAEQKKSAESARVSAAADRAAPRPTRKVLPSGEVVEGREVATSDAGAKRQAFLDGMNYTQAMHDRGTAPTPPDYMPNTPKNAGATSIEITKPPTGAAKSMSRPKGEETPRAQLESDGPAQQESKTSSFGPRFAAREQARKAASDTKPVVLGAKSANTAPRGKATQSPAPDLDPGLVASKRGQDGYEEEVAVSDEQTKNMQGEADQFFGRGGSTQRPEGPPIKEGSTGSTERPGVSSGMGGGKSEISQSRKGAMFGTPEKDNSSFNIESIQDQLPAKTGGVRVGVSSSDERSKSGTRDADPMASANRSMEPKVYTYKEGFAEHEGQTPDEVNVGPIAQKMKKDPVASTAIVEDKKSGLLGIDKSKGLKLVMGSVADLQTQIDELKGRKVRRGKYA